MHKHQPPTLHKLLGAFTQLETFQVTPNWVGGAHVLKGSTMEKARQISLWVALGSGVLQRCPKGITPHTKDITNI